MMNSRTYISDPKIWEAFYKNMAEKKFSPYKYKPKQIGRGMRKQKKSYVIPIRPHSQLEYHNPISQVTPVAAVEERAKSEHLKDVKEGVPYVKANKGIKRPSEHSSVIPSKKIEEANIGQEEERQENQSCEEKISLQKGNKHATYTWWKKVITKAKKNLFKIDSYKNVFKQ